MKRIILVIIGLFTIMTTQSQDLINKVIRLLTDCKQVKEAVVEDYQFVEHSFNRLDSIKSYTIDSLFVINKKLDKK